MATRKPLVKKSVPRPSPNSTRQPKPRITWKPPPGGKK